MGFAIDSDPWLRAAVWLGIGAFAVSLGLLVAVALVRMQLVARVARERAFRARWQPLLVASVERVPDDLPPLAQRDGEFFLQLWNRMHDALRGNAQLQLNELARRVGADRIAARFVASRSLRRRLIGVLTLGQLRDRTALAAVDRLLADERPALSLAAAQARLRIDAASGLGSVVDLAGRREEWAIGKLVSMLRECDAVAVSIALGAAIEAASKRSDAAVMTRLLRLAPTAHADVLRPAIRSALERATDPDALAAALAALQHPDDAALARAALDHEHPVVRLQATKMLGRLGAREDVPRFVALLSDPSWWVRYRSAQALVAAPWLGPGELEHIRSGLADRFALDMLAQAMAEPR